MIAVVGIVAMVVGSLLVVAGAGTRLLVRLPARLPSAEPARCYVCGEPGALTELVPKLPSCWPCRTEIEMQIENARVGLPWPMPDQPPDLLPLVEALEQEAPKQLPVAPAVPDRPMFRLISPEAGMYEGPGGFLVSREWLQLTFHELNVPWESPEQEDLVRSILAAAARRGEIGDVWTKYINPYGIPEVTPEQVLHKAMAACGVSDADFMAELALYDPGLRRKGSKP